MINKITIILSTIIVLISIFCFVEFKYYNSKLDKLTQQNSTLLMAGDLNLGRATTTFGDPKKADLDQDIQKDIASRNGSVESISKVEAHYEAHGTGTLVAPPPEIRIVSGGCTLVSVPFEFHDFRLRASGDAVKKTFQYHLDQKFEVISAETKLPGGAVNNYVELYELDNNQKRIGKLQLTKFEVVKRQTQPRFLFWDPALDIAFGGMISRNKEVGMFGSLGLSIMSYGREKDLSWRFIRLGVGIDTHGIDLSVAPFQYNFAQPIPLINNLFLTPAIVYTIDNKQYSLGLGVAAIL